MRRSTIGQDEYETTAPRQQVAGRVRRGADKEGKEGFGRVAVETVGGLGGKVAGKEEAINRAS